MLFLLLAIIFYIVSILNNITKHSKKEGNIMRPPLRELRNKLIRELRTLSDLNTSGTYKCVVMKDFKLAVKRVLTATNKINSTYKINSERVIRKAMTDFLRSWYIYEVERGYCQEYVSIDHDLCAEVKGFLMVEDWCETFSFIDSHHTEEDSKSV
jgi:hypothetical protein